MLARSLGKTLAIVDQRSTQHAPDVSARYDVFLNALMNGSSWEPTTAELVDSLEQLPPLLLCHQAR